MGLWVFKGLACLSGFPHLSLPGHCGGSPCFVQIWSSHFHQDWEGYTGDHPIFKDIFHKIPSGQQQPPVTTAGFIARGARRVQYDNDRRRMCLPPGEIPGAGGDKRSRVTLSLRRPNTENDGANQRKSWGSWEESWAREKSQIFVCSTDIFEIQYSPEKGRVPICFGGTDSAPNLWWTQSSYQLPNLTESQVRSLTASRSSGYNNQSSYWNSALSRAGWQWMFVLPLLKKQRVLVLTQNFSVMGLTLYIPQLQDLLVSSLIIYSLLIPLNNK